MDRVVAARKLLAELVKNEHLEVRRVDAVAKDLAAFAEQLGRPPSGSELEDWLGDHAQVSELYASERVLEALVDRHLAPPPGPIDAPDARHPELEQTIRDNPEDVAPYQVYADWLQEQGDPLGELITLGIAGDDERFERHCQVHGARLFGGLAKELLRRVHLHWKHGVVHTIEETVEHGILGPYEWARLLQLRVCGFVQSIALLQPCNPELDAVIAEHAPPTFREFSLYVSNHLPHDVLARELRSLAIQGRSLTLEAGALPPSLEQLELRVQVLAATAPIQLEIRELRITLTAPNAQHLADARFPKLERLVVLQPGPDVAPMLPALDFPSLTRLELRDGRLDRTTFGALARLSLAARLTSLALINLELTDDLAAEIAAQRVTFPALAELDVSFNELSRAGLATLREVAPSVVSTRQHRAGSGMERRIRAFAGSRLLAAESITEARYWREAGVDGDLRWARYRGTDRYELFITADLARYGCSCPSSIQPCKHVVALALVAERTPLPAAPSGGIENRIQRHEEIAE